MRLKYQLFLLLLLTGALLIALMAVIASWSFQRGFIGYINNTERARLEPLTAALAEEYQRGEGWQSVVNDPQVWKALIDTHLRFAAPGRRPAKRPAPGPPAGESARLTQPFNNLGTDDRERSGKRSERPERALTIDPRLLLADADQQLLIGRVRGVEDVQWQPIVNGDQTVGYLGYRLRTELPGQLDVAFANQQRRTFLYAAIAMVMLSALLAVALAGRVVRPLHTITDALARIGRGEYAHRVPLQRQDELGDLSTSINTLAATLEQNRGARQQWFAEISHELRTPVAVLQGELEAIQDGVRPLDVAAVDSLHAETLRLARLIDDLHELTLSDLGALNYQFERLSLAELVTERLSAARPTFAAANLRIEFEDPDSGPRTHSSVRADTSLIGDHQRLGQLVDNLIQNTLRYTDTGGALRVTLTSELEDIVLIWEDSAPGVDADLREHLFDPLYRVDPSRSRAAGGAGLGLAIVSKIAEAHGGRISAHASALGGLGIRVALPRRQERNS